MNVKDLKIGRRYAFKRFCEEKGVGTLIEKNRYGGWIRVDNTLEVSCADYEILHEHVDPNDILKEMLW